MKQIDQKIRELVIKYDNEEVSQRGIANLLKISRCSVQNIIKKQKLYGSVENRPKTGRPRVLTIREERSLIRKSLIDPFLTAPKLFSEIGKASVATIRRLLLKNGIYGRIAAKVPFLNKKHIKARLNWAIAYGRWSQQQWEKIIFSDESSIQLKPTYRVFVRRGNFNRYSKKYTLKTVKHGGKSLMVWGAIKANGERMLIRFNKNADSTEYQRVLTEGLLPFYDNEEIFQQDGAPCHRSKSTEKFFFDNGICFIDDWPAQSPDLNIIENMWSILKRNVSKHKCSNLDELWSKCQLEWSKIPVDYVMRLYRSIPDRLLCLRRDKGQNTSY